jgi:hypothetical protein
MSDRLLRIALAANAAFSTVTGLALSLAPGLIGDAMGGLPEHVLRGIGVGLLVFAAFVAWVRGRAPRRPDLVLAITTGDAMWVVGSVSLLLLPVPLSPTGIALVVGVAGCVALFAVLQLAGLRELVQNRGGMTSARSAFEVARRFTAPPEAVWPVVSDLDRIGAFYPALRDVEVVGRGYGAARTCETHEGKRWSEEVTQWDEQEHTYTLRFVSEAPDFPFPVDEMVGGWRVVPDGDGSLVTVWYEFSMRGGLLGDALAPLLTARSGIAMEDVLARMDAETSRTTRAA